MKTLYISDLDGTLLSPDAELSPYSREKLTELCEKGVYFSVATARTAATVSKMLAGIPLRVPVILMNGTCIYDLTEDRYVSAAVIPEDAQRELFEIMKGTSGFLYTVDEGQLHTFYEKCDTDHAREFREERERKYQKVFTKTDSFFDCLGRGCVYFSVAGPEGELRGLYERICAVESVHTEFYRDIYNTDFWYLEVCSAGVSKHNAAMWLREEYGFEYLVGFGDNLNDISLFEACDESYAVENAKDEVKARASGVIGANDGDSVIKFILGRTGL